LNPNKCEFTITIITGEEFVRECAGDMTFSGNQSAAAKFSARNPDDIPPNQVLRIPSLELILELFLGYVTWDPIRENVIEGGLRLKILRNRKRGLDGLILGGGSDRDHLTFHGPKSRVGFKIQIGFSIQEYISNKRLMTMVSLNVGNALKINEINFLSKSSLFQKIF
jgi:hypothetical protein